MNVPHRNFSATTLAASRGVPRSPGTSRPPGAAPEPGGPPRRAQGERQRVTTTKVRDWIKSHGMASRSRTAAACWQNSSSSVKFNAATEK